MNKRILATAVLITGLTLAAGPLAQTGQAAQAAPTASQAVRQDLVCVVNDDGVNLRGGPGTDFPVLTQVNRGQEFIYRNSDGRWIMGDVVGGPTGGWIYDAYLDC